MAVEEEDFFVRSWYMGVGGEGRWKLVLKEDLDYDSEEMAAEDVVLLYDQKRIAHPENKLLLEAWSNRSRRTFCHPVIRGNCLLVGRDPVTGGYRDLTEKDLERLKGKGETVELSPPKMTMMCGGGGMRMWACKAGLSGSGNSFENASTEELEETSTEAKVDPLES